MSNRHTNVLNFLNYLKNNNNNDYLSDLLSCMMVFAFFAMMQRKGDSDKGCGVIWKRKKEGQPSLQAG
jgi:hypothetical protein